MKPSRKANCEIKSAKLLGVREAHESMTFSTVNFTLYSFWIEYIDGSTEVVECSPTNPYDSFHKEKKLFEKLMAIANATEKDSTGKTVPVSDSSVMDELLKLKELHSTGIISDELFNDKKSILIDKLASTESQNDSSATSNFTIVRAYKRPMGEGHTYAFLDDLKLDANIDVTFSCNLDIGEHSIYFKRGTITSKKIIFSVVEGAKYRAIVNPKVFSIDIQVAKE